MQHSGLPSSLPKMASRATSPTSLLPFRFGARSDNDVQSKAVRSKSPDSSSERKRTTSIRSRSQDKGNEHSNDQVLGARATSPRFSGFGNSLIPLVLCVK